MKNRKIVFTQFYQFNDPFEFNFAVLPKESEIEKALKDRNWPEKVEVQEHLIKEYWQFGILCLVKNPRNLLMWSHYAENHRGYLIGFDTNHPFFNTKEIERVPFGYDNYDEINRPELGFGSCKKVKYSNKKLVISIGGQYNISELFFTKSKHWSYENEYRMIKNITSVKPEEREDNKYYLIDFPIECVRKIIIGVEMSPENEETILNIVKSFDGHKIDIFKAELSHQQYKIDLIPYDQYDEKYN